MRKAIHEAGHAVMAHIVGHKILHLSVIPRPGDRGSCLSAATASESPKQRVMCLMAGEAAECVFFGNVAPVVGDYLDPQGDNGKIHAILSHLEDDEYWDCRWAWFRETCDTLQGWRETIKTLADRLLKDGEIDGKEVHRIMAAKEATPPRQFEVRRSNA